jgi:hypothetical protein
MPNFEFPWYSRCFCEQIRSKANPRIRVNRISTFAPCKGPALRELVRPWPSLPAPGPPQCSRTFPEAYYPVKLESGMRLRVRKRGHPRAVRSAGPGFLPARSADCCTNITKDLRMFAISERTRTLGINSLTRHSHFSKFRSFRCVNYYLVLRELAV